MSETCQLCGRAVEVLTAHHLYPKSQGRRAGRKIADLSTVRVCRACHRQIHTLFSNQELARQFDSLDALRAHPEMAKFLDWVRRQDPNKRIKVRR